MARLAGVTIRVHVTFVLLVLLVAATASSVGESVAGAVGWILLLFACVVVHELAHAVVARAEGVRVDEIDLLPFGGVSRLDRIPEDWREESAIAVAGPLASAGLGLAALALAAALRLPVLPIDLLAGPLLVRLGWANLVLAAFNLVPAFPMDGGRVLRALLERSRPRERATQAAVRVSRALAAVFIAVGLLSNLWLVVIGAFVLVSGRAEEAAVLLHTALAPVPVAALAVASPVALRAEWPVEAALRLAADRPQVAYPVLDATGHVLGAATVRSLRQHPPGALVGQATSRVVADADEGLETVVRRAGAHPITVVRGDAVLGVITPEIVDGFLRQRVR